MPPDVVCGQRRSGSQWPEWTFSSFSFASSQPFADNSRQDSHTYGVFFSLGSSPPPLPQRVGEALLAESLHLLELGLVLRAVPLPAVGVGEAPQLFELCELPAEVVVVLKLCSV